MLLLKKHLVELVRAGKKTQTLRLWSHPIVRPGQISFTPGLGKMKIITVEEVPGFESLTEVDAVADGFATRAALLEELQRCYPEIPAGKKLYRVRFQWPLDDAGAHNSAPLSVKKTAAACNTDKTKKTPKPRKSGGFMTGKQCQKLYDFIIRQS